MTSTLRERTLLEVDDIIDLLEFVVTTTYFAYEGQIYQQCFGTAMGSPVSPVLVNLYMEWLEDTANTTTPEAFKPKLWKRYVDDILEIVPHDKIEDLTDHLNSIDPTGNIKFTFQKEEDKKLPFLDTLIQRKEDGSVKLSVYRKKTHTDQYLSFQSHHPLHHKLGVVRTLYDRKDAIVTDPEDRKAEEQHIDKALQVCGYPKWALKRVKDQISHKKEQKRSSNNNKAKNTQTNNRNYMVVLPYIQGTTEAVQRVLKKYNVTT